MKTGDITTALLSKLENGGLSRLEVANFVQKAYQQGRIDMIRDVIDQTNGEEAEEFEDDAEAELCRFGTWLGEAFSEEQLGMEDILNEG